MCRNEICMWGVRVCKGMGVWEHGYVGSMGVWEHGYVGSMGGMRMSTLH